MTKGGPVTISNYEEVAIYPLDPEVKEQLLTEQNECCFIWGPKDHWAVGVMMSYVWRDGSFWLTATTQRKRIAAIRRDPRVSVVVSGKGTSVGEARTVTAKGRVVLHEDDATKEWFYPALSERVLQAYPAMDQLREMFTQMLDSERRVVIEVVPEKWITYDASKLMADSVQAWAAQAQEAAEGASAEAGDP